MPHHHLPAVLIAPLATALLAHDLRRREASVDGPDVSRDERPVAYWCAVALNAPMMFVSWWLACAQVAGWLRAG